MPSVVDMAMVIGPTQPATLAVIIFADLNHADQAINARGTAGALFLTLVLAAIACVTLLVLRMLRPLLRTFLARGPSQAALSRTPGMTLLAIFALTYSAVVLVLAIMSVAGHWPFPQLLPEHFRADAWRQLIAAPAPPLQCDARPRHVGKCLGLAFWVRDGKRRFRRFVTFAAIAALGLPALLIAAASTGCSSPSASPAPRRVCSAHLAFVSPMCSSFSKAPIAHSTRAIAPSPSALNTTRLASGCASRRRSSAGPSRGRRRSACVSMRNSCRRSWSPSAATPHCRWRRDGLRRQPGAHRRLCAALALPTPPLRLYRRGVVRTAALGTVMSDLENVAILLDGLPLIGPFRHGSGRRHRDADGAGGSGKSSCLYVAGDLETLSQAAAASSRWRASQRHGAEARRIGRLFPDDLLFPLTVAADLLFGLPRGPRPIAKPGCAPPHPRPNRGFENRPRTRCRVAALAHRLVRASSPIPMPCCR